MKEKVPMYIDVANSFLRALNFIYSSKSKTVGDALKDLKALIAEKFNKIDKIDPDDVDFLADMQDLQNYVNAYTAISQGVLAGVIDEDMDCNDLLSQLTDISLTALADLYDILSEMFKKIETVS